MSDDITGLKLFTSGSYRVRAGYCSLNVWLFMQGPSGNDLIYIAFVFHRLAFNLRAMEKGVF